MSKYFRNRRPIVEIEADSLWELIDEKFILVDDDEPFCLTAEFYKDDFYEVPAPALRLHSVFSPESEEPDKTPDN